MARALTHGDFRPQLPPELERLDDLRLDVGRRRQAPLARCRVVFDYCSKPVSVGHDPAWASKPQVLLDGRAVFPEIALLALFQKAGWKGGWFDPVHRRTYDKMPNVSKGVGLDTRVASVLAKVNAAAAPGRRASCWDLVLGDGRTVLFVDVAPGPAARATRGSRGSTRRFAPASPSASSSWSSGRRGRSRRKKG